MIGNGNARYRAKRRRNMTAALFDPDAPSLSEGVLCERASTRRPFRTPRGRPRHAALASPMV